MYFIVSTGRSGTMTIARALSEVKGCVCLHEPAPELIMEASGYRYGTVKADEIKALLTMSRRQQEPGGVYCESNQNLSLVIPVLAETFPDARYIWLVRDGRDVVASCYQKQWYTGHSENHDRYEDCAPLEKAWIDGRVRGDLCGDMSAKEWEGLDRFGKICWYWSYVNRVIEDDLAKHVSGGKPFFIRLEDIGPRLKELVEWMGFDAAVVPDVGRANFAKHEPYHYSKWSAEERGTFARICGAQMDRLYPSWREQTVTGVTDAVTTVAHRVAASDEVRISVFITSYNQKGFLKEAIESVLAQTLRPHQVIIVDDASTDGSQELIEEYRLRHPGLVAPLYHERNTGVSQARVDALLAVTGDYVTYVDGDDRLLPEKLEKEARVLLANPDAHICFSNNYYINEEGMRTGIWSDKEPPPQGDVFVQTFARDFPRRNLFRMELVDYKAWKEVGFHDTNLRLYEDYDMRIRLTKVLRTVYCNEPLSEIRMHGKGLSSQDAARHFDALDYIFRKNRRLLKGMDRETRHRVVKMFGQWAAVHAKKAADDLLRHCRRKSALRYIERGLRYDETMLSVKEVRLANRVEELKTERDAAKAERNKVKAERDMLKAERNKVRVERDKVKTERDKAKTERDKAKTELFALKNSLSWKLSSPLRGVGRFFKK